MAEASEPIEVELKVAESNTQRQLNVSISATVAIVAFAAGTHGPGKRFRPIH